MIPHFVSCSTLPGILFQLLHHISIALRLTIWFAHSIGVLWFPGFPPLSGCLSVSSGVVLFQCCLVHSVHFDLPVSLDHFVVQYFLLHLPLAVQCSVVGQCLFVISFSVCYFHPGCLLTLGIVLAWVCKCQHPVFCK